MENLDSLKGTQSGMPAYRLLNANVFISPTGYHYIDYLDPVEEVCIEANGADALTYEEISYIEGLLQSHSERFDGHVNIVKQYLPSIEGRKVLDIGCGGGLFLAKIKQEGGIASGIELSASRAHYARGKYDLDIVGRAIEDPYWLSRSEAFDAVTLWDVIEHVNYPVQTLESAARTLNAGGWLFIDTPCRDSFYHRCGELTYKLSCGRCPTFLNSMYSAHKFGHKQIFSTVEMKTIFESSGLKVVELKKFHELSFPYRVYLEKMFNSKLLVELFLPIVHSLLYMCPVKNKMLVVAQKQAQ
jgi:2-polyprenyl-3-methyl-5-hydroxy-6-metoxy-1,4-benzoquinol methylase